MGGITTGMLTILFGSAGTDTVFPVMSVMATRLSAKADPANPNRHAAAIYIAGFLIVRSQINYGSDLRSQNLFNRRTGSQDSKLYSILHRKIKRVGIIKSSKMWLLKVKALSQYPQFSCILQNWRGHVFGSDDIDGNCHGHARKLGPFPPIGTPKDNSSDSPINPEITITPHRFR
ncbi:MAG: hypothetical protein MI741_02465 [Rhodospirillales bacterium]|nr:hypothetical protein [Rhodospirillales bacterium]